MCFYVILILDRKLSLKCDKIHRALCFSFPAIEQKALVFHLFNGLSVKSDSLDLREERYANYVRLSSVVCGNFIVRCLKTPTSSTIMKCNRFSKLDINKKDIPKKVSIRHNHNIVQSAQRLDRLIQLCEMMELKAKMNDACFKVGTSIIFDISDRRLN